MINEDTGLLLNGKDIKLHRAWFTQMTKLLGLKVLYRAPLPETKDYNLYGELDTQYYPPVLINCIYDEHPTQKTMRKLGWNAEMSDSTTIIHVPYDLENIQAGALFIIPSGLDNAEARVFKVLRMSNIAIYPSSIACELGPILYSENQDSNIHNFETTNFNLLDDESEDYS